jgi:hypothetical protein
VQTAIIAERRRGIAAHAHTHGYTYTVKGVYDYLQTGQT